MSSKLSEDALRAALTVFATRADLTEDARNALSLIIAGNCDGFGITPSGQLALTTASLARVLGVRTTTVVSWRGRRIGPPHIEVQHTSQHVALYPVAELHEWLRDPDSRGGFRTTPSLMEAFGLTPVAAGDSAEQEAA